MFNIHVFFIIKEHTLKEIKNGNNFENKTDNEKNLINFSKIRIKTKYYLKNDNYYIKKIDFIFI